MTRRSKRPSKVEPAVRAQGAVAAVLLAAIGGAVYLLAPVTRGRLGSGRKGERELRGAISRLGDRIDELSRVVSSLEDQSPGAD